MTGNLWRFRDAFLNVGRRRPCQEVETSVVTGIGRSSGVTYGTVLYARASDLVEQDRIVGEARAHHAGPDIGGLRGRLVHAVAGQGDVNVASSDGPPASSSAAPLS